MPALNEFRLQSFINNLDEKELLRELASYKPASRLSCQVVFTEDLSGLKVAIAPDE